MAAMCPLVFSATLSNTPLRMVTSDADVPSPHLHGSETIARAVIILSTTSIPSTSVWLPFIIPLEREFLTVTFLTTRASDSSGGIQRGVAAKAMRDATESSGNPGMTTKHAAHRSSFWSSIQWRPRNSAWEMRTWSSLKKRIVSFTLAHAAAWFLAGSSHHHGVPTSMQTSSALAKALLPVIPVSMVWKFMKSSVKCSRVMSSTTLLDPA
mmetsp:Transcript_98791/g.268287  ORF Transcript_98791/g.268287 Transcript_98791/m.268287 type:complete len:210 (-) Transcript_98791:781-1410(-)